MDNYGSLNRSRQRKRPLLGRVLFWAWVVLLAVSAITLVALLTYPAEVGRVVRALVG